VEPLSDRLHDTRLVVAEVQLEVRGQAGAREVRRAGDHALTVRENERLAVQEPLLVAPDLDLAGGEEVQESSDRLVDVRREGKKISVAAEPLLVQLQSI